MYVCTIEERHVPAWSDEPNSSTIVSTSVLSPPLVADGLEFFWGEVGKFVGGGRGWCRGRRSWLVSVRHCIPCTAGRLCAKDRYAAGALVGVEKRKFENKQVAMQRRYRKLSRQVLGGECRNKNNHLECTLYIENNEMKGFILISIAFNRFFSQTRLENAFKIH